jgi:hypothetical protein
MSTLLTAEPEPHRNDAAPQHWLQLIMFQDVGQHESGKFIALSVNNYITHNIKKKNIIFLVADG